jgi:hypothetical protein
MLMAFKLRGLIQWEYIGRGKKIQVGENTRQLKGKYGLLAPLQKAQLIYLPPLEVGQ